MEILKYCFIAATGISSLAVLVFAVLTGKPLKALLLNAFLGLSVTALLNITSKFIGVHVPINYWTVSGAAAFGVPAVCGILVLQIIFM